MQALLKDIWKLVRNWFLMDRIRVSKTSCRFLQFQPGQRLLVRDRIYRVQDRSELSSDGQLVDWKQTQQNALCLVNTPDSSTDRSFPWSAAHATIHSPSESAGIVYSLVEEDEIGASSILMVSFRFSDLRVIESRLIIQNHFVEDPALPIHDFQLLNDEITELSES